MIWAIVINFIASELQFYHRSCQSSYKIGPIITILTINCIWLIQITFQYSSKLFSQLTKVNGNKTFLSFVWQLIKWWTTASLFHTLTPTSLSNRLPPSIVNISVYVQSQVKLYMYRVKSNLSTLYQYLDNVDRLQIDLSICLHNQPVESRIFIKNLPLIVVVIIIYYLFLYHFVGYSSCRFDKC